VLNVDLSIRDSDGQAVVALRGQLSLADTPGVASHLIAAVAACGPSVIVDLASLDGIGYSGLSMLLRVRKWTRRRGGDLCLAAPQQPVRHILEATGLIDVFSVYPSVEKAADSIRQARAWSAPPRRRASVPPWLSDLAPSDRYATMPIAAWSGRCPGAECAGLDKLRGMPA
jgi:anti-sigma B factor antagonist